MRVAARKFAVGLWIGAVVVAAYVYVDLSHANLLGTPPETARWIEITIGGTYIILRSGALFVLGAIIWLLGDIRDRLSPEE